MEVFLMSFKAEIKNLCANLRIPEKVVDEFVESGSKNYVSFLESIGAKKIHYRNSLRSIEEVGHRGLILPGGNVVIMTELPSGEAAVLVQQRSDTKNIGFSGGAVEVWEFEGHQAVESPLVCAYREFYEEVGSDINCELESFGENHSTIYYPNGDVAFGMSFFYLAKVDFRSSSIFAAGGSDEGKFTLVRVTDLHNYEWFDNHAPILQKLVDMFTI